MKLLLDTCVISELQKPEADARVVRSMSRVPFTHLYTSVIVVAEIKKGIRLMEAGSKKQLALDAWIEELKNNFSDRIVFFDLDCAEIWASITAIAKKKGIVIPAADGMIAATAMNFGLTVATRNVKHFKGTGVSIYNPWED